jgi:hypothetical protein
MDDNDSREITLRIQKEDAFGDGNISSILDTRQWRKSLPADANGSILLDLETSMELALLHSREFQQQKEALYLSALDVTYERFQLGPVPFAGVSGQVSQEMDEDASDFQTRAECWLSGHRWKRNNLGDFAGKSFEHRTEWRRCGGGRFAG